MPSFRPTAAIKNVTLLQGKHGLKQFAMNLNIFRGRLLKTRLALFALLMVLIGIGSSVFYGGSNSISSHAADASVATRPIKTVFAAIQALPQQVALVPDKVALGERLFQDARLSSNDSISCASCHGLTTGGVDNRARSIGVNGAVGDINAPTVFNSGFNFAQFWNGRAATLEDQVEGPVNNPKEMASNWPQVVAKLSIDVTYPAQFSRLYGDGITPVNIKDAIATFERSLVTPNSRFDNYLNGDQAALSISEKRGFELFQSYGCSSCHQGVNLGGNMYGKVGQMGDYFADRGHPTDADLGRFNLDDDGHGMNVFKVPGLRNVARTAPYFHDGTIKTLLQAVQTMAKYQLGRPIAPEDMNDIVAFLESLTGEYKGKPL
jgi:cytochrome c peroxidase